MGDIHRFVSARLVVGVLTSAPDMHGVLLDVLAREFGPVSLSSEPMSFIWTDYYNAEMGTPIFRFFLEFENLVDPASLSSIKIRTNAIEDGFRCDGKRVINLDPGLLSADNLILATTKDRSHRIPLSDGIFAEVTLMYHGGQFQALPWTYADYRSDEIRLLFKTFRERYMAVLRKSSHSRN